MINNIIDKTKISDNATKSNKITTNKNVYYKNALSCLFVFDFTTTSEISSNGVALFENLPKPCDVLPFTVMTMDGTTHYLNLNPDGTLTTGYVKNIPSGTRLFGYIEYMLG